MRGNGAPLMSADKRLVPNTIREELPTTHPELFENLAHQGRSHSIPFWDYLVSDTALLK
jgi:hypothetical protein